jgi:uncharacterized membrane protein YesL
MGTVTLIGCILILPGPFVIAGLYAAGQKAVRGEGIKWSIYWQGMKEFGLRSWLLLIIILAGYGILYTNFWFYSNPDMSPFSEQVGFWLVPVWLGLAIVWTGTSYYAQAFLMELEEPKIFTIFRSSLFLTILHPLATLILVIVSLLVMALSVVFPILLILTPSFLFVLALTAIRTQITQLVERTKEEEEKQDENETQSEENSEK